MGDRFNTGACDGRTQSASCNNGNCTWWYIWRTPLKTSHVEQCQHVAAQEAHISALHSGCISGGISLGCRAVAAGRQEEACRGVVLGGTAG